MPKIAFKDFDRISGGGFLGFGEKPLEATVAVANEWISKENIKVINVETIRDTGGVGGISGTSEDGIRVWYSEG